MTMSTMNSEATTQLHTERKELEKSNETDCRLGICFRPKWARTLASPILLLVCYGFSCAVQGMIFVHYIAVISTFEAHFQLKSEVLGMVMSIGELIPILTAIVFGYYCGAGDRPRWISLSCWLISVGCFIAAFPFFIYGAPEVEHSIQNVTNDISLETTTTSLCTKSRSISALTTTMSPGNETNENCETHSAYEHSNVAVAIYLTGYTLFNCGAVIMYVVGTPYMDDNVTQKNSPLYMGIICSLRTIGPMLGFLLSFFCLSYHVTLSDVSIDPTDHRWIGAWWLGYIIIALLSAIGGIGMAQFPNRLPSNHLTPAIQMELNQLASNNEDPNEMQASPSIGIRIANSATKFIRTLIPVFKNRLVMLRIASEIFAWFAMLSYLMLLPKYMEHQFNISASDASIWTAFATIAPIVLGNICIGFYIQHFNPSSRKLSLTLAVSKLFYAVGILSLIFIHCDRAYVAGLDIKNQPHSCDVDCECPSLPFQPVCVDNHNYVSACHAGCTTVNYTTNGTFYEDCSCAESNQVVSNLCVDTCPEFTYYMVITTLANVLPAVDGIAGLIFYFRIVSIEQKTLAMGFGSMCISLFTFVPCPIVATALVDKTCALWGMTCGENGACLLYDIDQFRYLLHGFPFALLAISCIWDFLFYANSSKIDLYGEEIKIEDKRTDNVIESKL